MTSTTHNADKFRLPKVKTRTHAQRAARSSIKSSDEKRPAGIGLSEDEISYLETCVANGELTEERRQRLETHLEARQLIDPETAEVKCQPARAGDPYGVFQNAAELGRVKRTYFARSPGSDIWVEWDHLPTEVQFRLWRKHKKADAGLRDPSSCWPAFCHSKYFRKDVPDSPVTENDVRYIRFTYLGPFPGE